MKTTKTLTSPKIESICKLKFKSGYLSYKSITNVVNTKITINFLSSLCRCLILDFWTQLLSSRYGYHPRFHLHHEDFCLPLFLPELIITEELQGLILPKYPKTNCKRYSSLKVYRCWNNFICCEAHVLKEYSKQNILSKAASWKPPYPVIIHTGEKYKQYQNTMKFWYALKTSKGRGLRE